ncbi:hypothetical protein RJZ57_004022 [Blastomyces gilchristii]
MKWSQKPTSSRKAMRFRAAPWKRRYGKGEWREARNRDQREWGAHEPGAIGDGRFIDGNGNDCFWLQGSNVNPIYGVR